MKKFQFSLEKVLDFRKANEQAAKRAYADAHQAQNLAMQQLQQLQHEKATVMDVSEMTIGRMQVQQRYLQELDRLIFESFHQFSELQQKTEEALQAFIQAQKERKILEKLQEKQLAEYQLIMSQEEQKFLDELGSQRTASMQ